MHMNGNAERNITEINTGDSPDMIRICLNCDLPKCIERCPRMLKAKGINPTDKRGKPGVMYPYKDGAMTLAEAEKKFGIQRKSLRYRMEKLNMTLEQAVEKGMPFTRNRKEKSV